MLKVYIPNNNIKEREYIIDVMLKEFLGLSYELIIDNGELIIDDWIIELENGNRLIVKDSFFNNFKKELEYLNEKNIPKEVKFVKSKFASEDDIVVIYGEKGEGRREKEEGRRKKGEGNVNAYNPSAFSLQPSTLITNIDLFASAFFMLTRWEEYVNKKRDNHNRFLESEALAVKFGFINRPIVNEYVEYLWNLLTYLGIKQSRKKREYKITITHDIDFDLLYKNPINFVRRVASSLIKQKSLNITINEVNAFLRGKDPYNTFDFLMDISESIGAKSYFFFMASGSSKYDNNYKSNSNFILQSVKKIKQRGHKIGMHYSYNASFNKEQLLKEKKELEANFGVKIDCGRAHYLRFEVPISAQILDEAGFIWDSSLGYERSIGFRSGVCYEYPLFNFLTRKRLNLKEKPLNVMETTLIYFKDLLNSEEKFIDSIEEIKNRVNRYNGEFVLLWHNSNLDSIKYPNILNLYKKAVS